MFKIRFGYSVNPKAIVVSEEDTINNLCAQHDVQYTGSVVNHNGLPLAPALFDAPLRDLEIEEGDSIIIVTKTNAA